MEKSGKCAKCGDMQEQFVNIPAPGDDHISVLFEETSRSICKVEMIIFPLTIYRLLLSLQICARSNPWFSINLALYLR